MKRTAILLIFALLLCACQPTPEVDAVKQKDTNVLIDTVKTDQQEQQNAGAALPPVKEQFPERFQCDLYTTAQNVHVTADTPIEVLSDAGGFPMLRVERRYLTDAERQTAVQRILGSEQLYIYRYQLTRSALEAEIKNLMQEPTPTQKKEWMRDNGATEEEWQQSLENRKALLEEYQRQYNLLDSDATSEPLKPWDGTAPAVSKDRDVRSQIDIVRSATDTRDLYLLDHVTLEPNEYGLFPIEYESAWRDINDTTSHWAFESTHKFGTVRIDAKDWDKPYGDAAVTPYQAIARVQAIFEGVADLKAADVYWANNAATDGDNIGVNAYTRYAYLIHLSANYGGAYLPFCHMDAYDDALNRVWDYESLTAVVDGSGELLALCWTAPLKVTETLAENTPLLPIEEIQSIFEQQINRVFAEERYHDGTLTVDRVQLGLFRIREQNDMDHGLLVPVWYFTGVFEYGAEQAEQRKKDGFREWERSYYDTRQPLLIINAIDGSMIDPMKGY